MLFQHHSTFRKGSNHFSVLYLAACGMKEQAHGVILSRNQHHHEYLTAWEDWAAGIPSREGLHPCLSAGPGAWPPVCAAGNAELLHTLGSSPLNCHSVPCLLHSQGAATWGGLPAGTWE